jgi:hypothetical protein
MGNQIQSLSPFLGEGFRVRAAPRRLKWLEGLSIVRDNLPQLKNLKLG